MNRSITKDERLVAVGARTTRAPRHRRYRYCPTQKTPALTPAGRAPPSSRSPVVSDDRSFERHRGSRQPEIHHQRTATRGDQRARSGEGDQARRRSYNPVSRTIAARGGDQHIGLGSFGRRCLLRSNLGHEHRCTLLAKALRDAGSRRKVPMARRTPTVSRWRRGKPAKSGASRSPDRCAHRDTPHLDFTPAPALSRRAENGGGEHRVQPGRDRR